MLDSVELDAAAPPGVTADVWVCRGTRIAFRDGLMAGARGTLSQFCRRAVPVAGQALVGGARDILLLRVRADRPGVLRVHDVRVRYRVGSQHGTQVVPVDLVAAFRRHALAS